MKIGIIAPLTGEGATYGKYMKNGFDLAFYTTNYQLIYEDSKLNPKDGLNALNKLINFDKVEVIYGAASSSVTLAIAPQAEKNKKIVFSSISTADAIRKSGDYIFRNVPSNFEQGNTAANFLLDDLNIRKIAILKENDDYGLSIAKSFREQVERKNGVISIEETYISTDTDFRTQLFKVKSSGAFALFIPGNYEESALILKQAKELGIEIPIIGGDGSYSDDLIKVAGNSSEGFYCTHFGINTRSSFYTKFIDLYKSKYGKEPNVYEAYAFEAGMILREAIESVSNKATSVKDYLYNNEFESLTGKISFDNNGDVDRNFGVLMVKDKKFENIK